MKPHKKFARTLGYDLLRRRTHGTSNTHLINLINHHRIDLVLDVGANRGQFGAMLRDEGYRGAIHSFEPVSRTFAQLSQACDGDEKWSAHRMAMGEVAGQQAVNITEASDMASFLDPNDFGRGEFARMDVAQIETVEVGTIAEFVGNHLPDFSSRRTLLKMDTQGYDLKAFAGATGVLETIVCILSEISLIPIYTGMPHYLESLGKYEKAGFVVTGLYPISRKADLSVIEMDCMMLNKRYAKG